MFRIKMFDRDRGSDGQAASGRGASGAWRNRLRPAKRTRPLQISEVVQAAEEHLRAAALPSLRSRYLPTFLTIRVSSADWRSLSPFEDHLRQEIRATYDRLSEQPRLSALSAGPRIEFARISELALGDVPELESSFARRVQQASWSPGAQARGDLPADPEVAFPGVFEVVMTLNPRQGTARQSVFVLCLTPDLPRWVLEPDAEPGESLHFDEGGEIAGGSWRGGPPEVLPGADGDAGSEEAGPALRFHRGRTVEVLWAPHGSLSLGREPGEAHWVPASPPANLSGRHLAWRVDAAGEIEVVDLGSTNGTFLAGERLAPSRPVPLRLPACLEIGRQGAVRLELRPVVLPEGQLAPLDRSTKIGPPDFGGTLEEVP